jgi:hypothetical protein
VKVMNLDAGDAVVDVARVVKENGAANSETDPLAVSAEEAD